MNSDPEKPGQPDPRPHEIVMVHCQGFRCLGYRDEHGVWRNAYNHDPLPPVLRFERTGL